MSVLEFDGKDLDDALRAAAGALGVPVERLDYVLVEEGRKGVFGLGARPVRIRVQGDPGPASMPREAAPAPTAEPSAASRALRRMIDLMGLTLTLEEDRREGTLGLVVDGPDRGK